MPAAPLCCQPTEKNISTKIIQAKRSLSIKQTQAGKHIKIYYERKRRKIDRNTPQSKRKRKIYTERQWIVIFFLPFWLLLYVRRLFGFIFVQHFDAGLSIFFFQKKCSFQTHFALHDFTHRQWINMQHKSVSNVLHIFNDLWKKSGNLCSEINAKRKEKKMKRIETEKFLKLYT